MNFADLRLAEPLLRAIAAQGYSIPTPIQMQAIPHVLSGRDLLGCAQTGTGKTAAFALPILHRLMQTPPASPRRIRALILAPTRELSAQIGDSIYDYGRYTGLRHTVIFGGVNQNSQVRALRSGVDTVVATPGRLLDLMQQGFVDLRSVEVLVLDEADRMLDMGFIHDIRQVVAKLPARRQTLLFSATMPSEIRQLANALLTKPVEVRVAAESAAADTVEQFVYFVPKSDKASLLRQLLLNTGMSRTLVFTRTKHGADRVVKVLRAAGLKAEAIHGNKKQNARQRALRSFQSQQPPVLVATDIASRGIDVDGISHVINYDIPNEPETYVHRIGRTGRAGAEGIAFSFCDGEERQYLKAIERLIRQTIPVRNGQQFQSAPAQPALAPTPAPQRPTHTKRPTGQFHLHTSGKRPTEHPGRRQDSDKAVAVQRPRAFAGAKPHSHPGKPTQRKHHAHPFSRSKHPRF
ncbi:MAG TPA: DEAD/DEAH box helicase [Tepidisphaeraceae bacterium]|nr:DEAD/DEAH box helicase [Tepidisphaeraceae bacterium]